MNVIFVTRCYKPTNIQKIKENLKRVFDKQTEHSYVQYLVVDMSYGEKQQTFNQFVDEHTKVFFTYNKKDHYNNWGMDELFKRLEGDQNWIYVLDDDNLINDNFLDVFKHYTNEDVLVCNYNKDPFVVGRVVGFADTRMYIVKLKVRKEVPIYVEGEKSYPADGVFFERLIKKGYKMNYTKQFITSYGALKRPLNVLRPQL